MYSQVTDIINRHHTDHAFSQYFDNPAWAELATTVSDILTSMPPIYFFIDSVDEEYANAPMFWLQCQKGLFFRTMRFLRDQHFGGRLHVVACVRDHVLASVLRSEHQNRYRGEPHILSLEWDYGAAKYFLEQKLFRLDERYLMRTTDGAPTVGDWLGLDEIENKGRCVSEPITQYLLRHTRLLPRDIVILGNLLCQNVESAKHNGADRLDPQVVRRCVREAAKSFGIEQLAICANHIASSGMPADAALRGYDEIYTGDSEYSRGLAEKLVELIRLIGKDRFGREDLEVADLHSAELFGEGSDALSVLWQNRLLGCTEETPDGALESFFSETSPDHFALPRDRQEYCLHSSMIDLAGIRAVGAPVGRAQVAHTPVPGLGGKPEDGLARSSARRAGDDDPSIPGQIGSYPVLKKLGRGGMGVVYLAEDTQLKRRIAIKVLPGGFARDRARLARFNREARILAGLNHPNIATIYSLQEHGGRKFLTMEFVSGDTLHQLIYTRAITVPDVLRFASQIARALQAAHRGGVVHRDLKPANVMITEDQVVKVLDFGLAKALTGEAAGLSAAEDHSGSSEFLLGTPGYMSPEQLRGDEMDRRADLWGLGCTLFECLAGEPAFGGRTPMQRVRATLHAEPPWQSLPRRTPRKTRALLRQCLEKDPDHRIHRVELVLEMLGASGG